VSRHDTTDTVYALRRGFLEILLGEAYLGELRSEALQEKFDVVGLLGVCRNAPR
jgi:hypothetical protein